MTETMTRFADMTGKTITAIDVTEGAEEVRFIFSDGAAAMLYHEQDCCEFVRLSDIAGNLGDLIGTPILKAEESSNCDGPPPEGAHDNSWTWTFYLLATVKGHVTLRWLGTSNGYYSGGSVIPADGDPDRHRGRVMTGYGRRRQSRWAYGVRRGRRGGLPYNLADAIRGWR